MPRKPEIWTFRSFINDCAAGEVKKWGEGKIRIDADGNTAVLENTFNMPEKERIGYIKRIGGNISENMSDELREQLLRDDTEIKIKSSFIDS